MLTTRRLSALLLVGGLLACSRNEEKPGVAARLIASGDAVWFEDGIGPEQTGTEKELLLAGFSTAFLPAVRLAREGGRVTATELPPPPRPFEKTPVFLAVVGGPELASATADAASADSLAQTVAIALQGSLKTRALYASTVAGVHMDVPFAPGSAEAYGAFLKSLRRKIPAKYLLTFSLRFTPDEADRARLAPALAAADGFVAFVFGETATASPVAADELGRPWWAAYSPGARGVWRDSSGKELGSLGEKHLIQLSDDPRVDVKNDLTFREEATSAFLLSPQQPLTAAGTAFSAGDRLFFRQPSLSEMLYRFGADQAGRRRLRGRMLVLPGTSEGERLVTLGALADVILGHSLDPDLRVSLNGALTPAVVVSAHNASHHASVISRTQNWVEVDLPVGAIRDVQPGGFDRYEEYDGEGRSVTPGRATRVRFFETLVGPLERIDPAKILLYKPAPADCCRYRYSVASSAGPEVKSDWVVPTPVPTPVPPTRHKRS
ncbi:MAG TPA: hypothetical protein VGS00_03855 [Thermoanaerobaculia bacterium]|nr:hypothetical protein [Thermoanaerobaculia bacterium]